MHHKFDIFIERIRHLIAEVKFIHLGNGGVQNTGGGGGCALDKKIK